MYLDRQRTANIKSKYKLSLEDLNNILEKQDHKCAICKIPVFRVDSPKHTNNTMVIDHCHTTNIVRGVLCSKCNRGLGHFNDDFKLITQAIKYLRRNSKRG